MNKKIFNSTILKSAQIQQSGEEIEFIVEYDFKDKSCIPFLGFVINDSFGNHVCGLNPSSDNAIHDVTLRKSGIIKVVLNYPKLLNGVYSVSDI